MDIKRGYFEPLLILLRMYTYFTVKNEFGSHAFNVTDCLADAISQDEILAGTILAKLKLMVARSNVLNFSIPQDNQTLCNHSSLFLPIMRSEYSDMGHLISDPFDLKNRTNLSEVTTVLPTSMNLTTTTPGVGATSPVFFVSLRIIANSLLHLRRSSCEKENGTYDSSVGVCISHLSDCINKHDCLLRVLTKGIDNFATYVIGLSGTVTSILCLSVLLITYTIFNKELQTLPGKNIMCLSGTMMLTHIVYTISLHADIHAELCKVVGILLHWLVISSFLWMAVIAFDLYVTFRKPSRLSSMQKRNRFHVYLGFTFGISVFILTLCITLEFSGKNLMGYGIRNICFVTNFWANLFGFVVPVGSILLINTILLVLTVKSIYTTQKKVRKSVSKEDSWGNNKLHFTLMTLKLTALSGLGWIIAFLASLLQSPALTYLSIALISLQGVFVFVGFVCTRRVYKLYRKKLQHNIVETSSSGATATTTDACKAESSL